MKIMSSQDFRKKYARLTEKVLVTAYGHPIGVWEPFTAQLSREMVDEHHRMDKLDKELDKETRN